MDHLDNEEASSSSSSVSFEDLVKLVQSSKLTNEQRAIMHNMLGGITTATSSAVTTPVTTTAGVSTSTAGTSQSSVTTNVSVSTSTAATSQPSVTTTAGVSTSTTGITHGTTLASHLPHVPRLSVFNGDGKEVSYDQWRFEVRSMIHEGLYPNSAILHAVRRSVKGIAANIMLHLGENVTLDAILNKFDHAFGNILSAEMLLEQFYAAKQKSGEDITSWACRLEGLKLQIQSKDPSTFSASDVHLANRFWSGLHNKDIHNALRHKVDNKASYNELLVSARTLEVEMGATKTAHSHQATTQEKSAIDKVLDRVGHLEKMIQDLHSNKQKTASNGQQASNKPKRKSNNFKGTCYKCGQYGHPKARCPLNSSQPVRRDTQLAASNHVPQTQK